MKIYEYLEWHTIWLARMQYSPHKSITRVSWHSDKCLCGVPYVICVVIIFSGSSGSMIVEKRIPLKLVLGGRERCCTFSQTHSVACYDWFSRSFLLHVHVLFELDLQLITLHLKSLSLFLSIIFTRSYMYHWHDNQLLIKIKAIHSLAFVYLLYLLVLMYT